MVSYDACSPIKLISNPSDSKLLSSLKYHDGRQALLRSWDSLSASLIILGTGCCKS